MEKDGDYEKINNFLYIKCKENRFNIIKFEDYLC